MSVPFIYSIRCLRIGPQPVPKPAVHTVISIASSFKFQYRPFSLSLSSSCLRILPHLSLPAMLPSVACFRRQFLRKLWPIQLSVLIFTVCKISLSLLTPCNILFNFSHDQPNWSSPSFSSTSFQNFPGISYLLSEQSSFQHHSKLCSKHNICLYVLHNCEKVFVRL